MRRTTSFVRIWITCIILAFSLGAPNVFSQEVARNPSGSTVTTSPSTGGTVKLSYTFDGTYTLVERSNWSQYVNGRYIGLTSREARGYLDPVGTGNWRGQEGIQYTGDFFVFQQTKRDNRTAAQGIDDIAPSTFVMLEDGSIQFTEMCYYPQLRNFPVFPKEKVKKGSRWQGMAERVVDPRNDKQYTVLEVPVEYEFMGEEKYKGKPVYKIRAKYATRFNKYNPPRIIDSELSQATGTHDVEILVDKATCAIMMILDTMDETFTYRNGETVRYKGSTALFTEIPVQVDERALYERAVYIASGKEAPKTPLPIKEDNGGLKGKAPAPKKDGGLGGSMPPKKDDSLGYLDTPKKEGFGGSGFPQDGGFGSGKKDSGAGKGGSKDTGLNKGPGQKRDEPQKKPALDEIKESRDGGMFQVEDTDKGVRLSVRDLKFVADSSQLLSQERGRLDAVAEVLKSVPGGTFLIEGHTAAVGRPAGEQQLSEERAQSIVAEMVKRGLKEEQFMFKGYGGTRPVGDNNTNEGRAANRRVEITILQ